MEHCEQKLTENEAQLKLAEYMPQQRDVWTRLAQREHLDEQAFDYATWAFAGKRLIHRHEKWCWMYLVIISDGSLRSPLDRQGDLTKARQFGWTTTVETFDGYAECFDRLKTLKVIPS